jgi:ornithine cyclodeaminase/alanine dehydrogenase-like protein (mu-crystallin family)
MPLWLSESDVRAVLAPGELIDVMQDALAAFSIGRVTQPVRTALETEGRSFFVMPALDNERGILSTKLVGVIPANAAKGLHTHPAAISLFDSNTGELLAIMDGRYITETRTAAVSAVSVRHLARPGSAVLAILGSGVQARSHRRMLPLVCDFREIRAWSPNPAHLSAFCAECGVHSARSPEEAVRGADVVVVATNSVAPVIESAWLGDGAHVIALGASRPSQQEIDSALVQRAHLVVDSREAALRESGDILRAIAEGRITSDHVHTEIGEIVAGVRPGRQADTDVTLFKSLGQAIEDLAAADLAYRRARDSGKGLRVEF